MTVLQEGELDAGELISGMSVGVAHFDAEDQLLTTNDRFGALLPLIGGHVTRHVTFRDLLQAALHRGQFDLGSMSRSSWTDLVLTAFDQARGVPIELKRSDSRWLLLSCRMTALGHRICNLVDISNQKRLSEFIAEFSMITGSRQINSMQRLDRMLLLGCAHLNLPVGAVLRSTGQGSEVIASASPSGSCHIDLEQLHNRVPDDGRVTIEPLDSASSADELDSVLIGMSFRLDEGDVCTIIFAGDHWGDGPLDNTDRQLLTLLGDWTGQELARYSDQLELEQAYEELRLAATTCPLTGCFNRRHFLETAEATRNFHRRIAKPWALLMLDIDHFKSVNDTYGHAAGDHALCQFAEQVRLALRNHDLVARYGGEEFAVFLYNADIQSAELVAERIRENVAKMWVTLDDFSFKITVSIGLCHAAADRDLDIGQALIQADRALYEAKAAGRNCLRFAVSQDLTSA